MYDGSYNCNAHGFQQGFVELQHLGFISKQLRHMKPQRERSDYVVVGQGRLADIVSSFHVHGKEGLLPVSDECWMLHQDSKYERPECIQFNVSSDSELVDHHVLLLV